MLLAVMLLLAVGGCGPMQVRSAPPGTELDGLTVDGETLVLRLLIDNRNDIPMPLTGARMVLTLDRLELEPREWPLTLVVGPRNREALELRLPASGAALGTLGEIDSGERSSLPYTLIGQLRIDEGRDARINRTGYLHPVPGRPGRYR